MAAFGGISGNFPALEAVLADIERRGIHTIVNTGNAVVGYPWPNDVVHRLQAKRIRSVQGVLDRMAVRARRKGESLKSRIDPAVIDAVDWTHRATFSRHLEYLGTLSKKSVFTIEGLSVCLCHGTPSSLSERLQIDDGSNRFRRQREYANVHIIVMGGGRLPFSKLIDETLFVNPGCAGYGEADGPSACYAVIGTEDTPWSVEFRHVPYDLPDLDVKLKDVQLNAPWHLPDEYV